MTNGRVMCLLSLSGEEEKEIRFGECIGLFCLFQAHLADREKGGGGGERWASRLRKRQNQRD